MSTSDTELTYYEYVKEFQSLSSQKLLSQKNKVERGFNSIGQLSFGDFQKQTFVKLIPPKISLDLPAIRLDQEKAILRGKSRLAMALAETVEVGTLSPSQQNIIDKLKSEVEKSQNLFNDVDKILQTQTSTMVTKLISLKKIEQELNNRISIHQTKDVPKLSATDLHEIINLNQELLVVTRQFDELTQAQFSEQDIFLVREPSHKLELKTSQHIKVRIP